MINLISKSMRTKIIERGWKKERERRNWIDSISLSSPSMRLFSVDWRRWRCGHFLALWTAKKSWTPRSWTKRAGPGHARLSGTETGNLFGELHPVAFLVFPSVSPTYLCSPRVSNVSFSLLLYLSLSRRNGIWKRVHLLRDWNLQCVIHFYIFCDYSKYLKLVERFSWSTHSS